MTWSGAYPRRPQEDDDVQADERRAVGVHEQGALPALREDAEAADGAPSAGRVACGQSAATAPAQLQPAIACRYCRTGSALRWEQTRRLTGKAELAELHDPGCTTKGDLDDGKSDEVALYCQGCGQERTGSRFRWIFALRGELRCPRCASVTEHHAAPADVVAAEECLCGRCRTRRAFEEAEERR